MNPYRITYCLGLLVFLLCIGSRSYAQETQSFEEYKKTEKAKFQKFKEEERRKFEAFKRNELDWNKEILGYEVETPVSERVEIANKDQVAKPPAPMYVNLEANLEAELVQIQRKIQKQVPLEMDEEEAPVDDTELLQEAKKEDGTAKENELTNEVEEVKTKATPVKTEKIKPPRDESLELVNKEGVKAPNVHRESLIEAEVRSIPSAKPIVGSFRLSSKFGNRFHPSLFRWQFHSGLDMACAKGTPVLVPADGVVVKSGWVDGYGNFIKVRHGNGYETVYAHLSKIKIRKGQKVSKGDVIGEVGSTGRSTGPHLHYEILKNKKRVNPERFFG